jgi:hypothetical protein
MNFFELINNTFVRFFVFETWLEVDPAPFPLEFSQGSLVAGFNVSTSSCPNLLIEFLTPKQLPFLGKENSSPFSYYFIYFLCKEACPHLYQPIPSHQDHLQPQEGSQYIIL